MWHNKLCSIPHVFLKCLRKGQIKKMHEADCWLYPSTIGWRVNIMSMVGFLQDSCKGHTQPAVDDLCVRWRCWDSRHRESLVPSWPCVESLFLPDQLENEFWLYLLGNGSMSKSKGAPDAWARASGKCLIMKIYSSVLCLGKHTLLSISINIATIFFTYFSKMTLSNTGEPIVEAATRKSKQDLSLDE